MLLSADGRSLTVSQQRRGSKNDLFSALMASTIIFLPVIITQQSLVLPDMNSRQNLPWSSKTLSVIIAASIFDIFSSQQFQGNSSDESKFNEFAISLYYMHGLFLIFQYIKMNFCKINFIWRKNNLQRFKKGLKLLIFIQKVKTEEE